MDNNFGTKKIGNSGQYNWDGESTEKVRLTRCLFEGHKELFGKILLILLPLCVDVMKRTNARDISSFFTKKTIRENEAKGQASEPPPAPEIILTPPQISAQSSSPSVNVPEAALNVLTLAHDPGRRKKNERISS